MDRGYLLRRLALAFAAIGIVLAGWYIYALPKTIKIAVGPADSAQHRFAQAIVKALKDTQQSYKLELVVVADSVAASAALDRHKVHMAILRSDDTSSEEARAVAVLQRRQLIVIARKDAGITSIADLKGRPTALLNVGPESMRGVFASVLQHYGISIGEVPLDELDAQALPQATKRHDAFVLFANPASGLPRTIIDAVAKRDGSEVVLVPIQGAEGMVLRFRELQKSSIPAGAFGGTPPSPAAALPTVAMSYELVATSEMSQTDAKELLSSMLEARTRIRRLLPRTSFDIEAPPLEEQRRFLPHIGAEAYVNDDDAETFLDTYSDQIWLALFGVSLLGSSIAGFLGWTGYFDPKPSRGTELAGRIRALAERLDGAQSQAELDSARAELDSIVLASAKEHGKAPATGSEAAAAALIATLSGIIARRQDALTRAPELRRTA